MLISGEALTFLKELDLRDATEVGNGMHRFMRELYPICRSITGDGIRQTLSMIGNCISLRTYEVPSGTPVFDWTVPKEWNIRDAFINNSSGKKVVVFGGRNFPLLNYTPPV